MNNEPIELTGTVERITYFDSESHFVVAALKISPGQTIPIVGTMPELQVGGIVRAKGNFKEHPKHGRQFEVESFEYELPVDTPSIERFLASGAVRGVGPTFAAKLCAAFGAKTLEIIDKEPERLKEIEGLGKKRRLQIQLAWQEHKLMKELYLFLSSFGITRTYSRKILQIWGPYTLQKIKENPYALAKEINGIGFIKADAIAKKVGIAHDAPERIAAGIDYVLFETAQNGHSCYPLEAFVEKTSQTLSVSQDAVRTHIGRLHQSGQIELARQPDGLFYVWSKPLFVSERGIAAEIVRLQKPGQSIRDIDLEKAIIWAEVKQRLHFALMQKEALQMAICEKFSIITGGPGTGKSTITKALVLIFEKITKKIALCAPTGRAAKRLTEITGRYAQTIHRLLKFDFITGSFSHSRDNPVDVDMIIIDEASMIDTYLMYQLLRALPPTCKVVVIGDADQLPSIGPGTVLRDMIASEKIPTARLSFIFRQAQGSKIILNAHKINAGEMPFLQNEEDFIFIEEQDAPLLRKKIIDLVCTTIPADFGFDPKKEIQVLAPMRKGPCGIEILNRELQEKLTPGPSKGLFRIGDKVIQMKNNYQKEVFNGDVGFVSSYDETDGSLGVMMDDREVIYEFRELDELALAYAVSVHKYQGSESPVIVMPVHTAHFVMLNKNLLYTAITRGKKVVFLVGTKKAIAIACKNQKTDERYTALKEAISLCYEIGVPGSTPATSKSTILSSEPATSSMP